MDIPNPFAAQPKVDEAMLENEAKRQVNKVVPNTPINVPNEQMAESKLNSEVNKVKPNTNINTPNVSEKTLEQKVKTEALNNKPDTSKIDQMERMANNADPEKRGKMIIDEGKMKAEQKAREDALKPIKKTKFNPLD
jgi:hypothetical protein